MSSFLGGSLIVTLDFELLWGAIPRILDIFTDYDIAATWATVGFLFFDSRAKLFDALSPKKLRPDYNRVSLSNYSYLDETGANEKADPCRLGASLDRQKRDAPRQEIGTHTFSHYYCLEGAGKDSFRAYLERKLQPIESHLAAVCLGGRSRGKGP